MDTWIRWTVLLAVATTGWAQAPDETDSDHDQVLSYEELKAAAEQEQPYTPRSAGQPEDVLDDFDPDAPAAEVSSPPLDERTRRDIEKITGLYLRMYAQHLRRADWITRAMAVISLNRIDDPRVTEKLLEVLRRDRSSFVRVYAWEALYARRDTLTEPQLRQWRNAGIELAMSDNVLHGQLRRHLLTAIQPMGPTEKTRSVIRKFFAESNLCYEPDILMLEKMGEMLAEWNQRPLVEDMIEAMKNGHACYRADFVLRAMNPQVTPLQVMQRNSTNLVNSWVDRRKEYLAWLETVEWGPKPPARQQQDASWVQELTPGISGDKTLLDAPEVMRDPDAPKWQKDLELPRFNLDQFYVTLVMDSTGSMGPAIDWVKRDVIRLMRALKAISREPAIGVVFYRDKGEAYRTRVHPMTGSGRALARAIRGTDAAGGGDFPEDIYSGLKAALEAQKWPSTTGAHKSIILIGDAPARRKQMPHIQSLLEKYVGNGFTFHCMSVPTRDYQKAVNSAEHFGDEIPIHPATCFNAIAEWGGGMSTEIDFIANPTITVRAGEPIAEAYDIPWGRSDPTRQIVAAVMKDALLENYHDRVRPFVRVLLEIIDRAPEEKRTYLPPKEPKEKLGPGPGPKKKRKPKRYRQSSPSPSTRQGEPDDAGPEDS